MAIPPFTLDPTKPLDTDQASAGASDIRTTRDQLISCIGIEHTFSTGVHLAGSARVAQGTLGVRPAPSLSGHLYYETDTASLDIDTGVAWVNILTKMQRWAVGASTTQSYAADGVLRDIDSLTQTIICAGKAMNFRASLTGYLVGTLTGPARVSVALLMDSTELTRGEATVAPGVNGAFFVSIEWIVIPTAASHTFHVQCAAAKSVGGDSITINFGSGTWNSNLPIPRFMIVQELIGNAV